MGILTDSYKASHYLQYPACREMVAVCTAYGHICLPFRVQSTILFYGSGLASERLKICSMGNFVVALTKTLRTHGWLYMGYVIY